MSDDLVKRLRLIGEKRLQCTACYKFIDTADEAASRIEKLEAALQEFVDPCIEHCFDTCQSECDPMKDCPCFKARKALDAE